MPQSPASPAPVDGADDPLGVNDLIRESFNLIDGDTVSIEEEGRSMEALTERYQSTVAAHFATIAASEQRAVQAMEQDVEAWAQETAKHQAALQNRAQAAPNQKGGNTAGKSANKSASTNQKSA